MPRERCRAPGCGRFVAAGAGWCARHRKRPGDELDVELDALRTVLTQVMAEVQDAEARAKLVPRLVSVAIQAHRTRHQTGAGAGSELMELLRPILEELDQVPNADTVR